MKKSSHKSKPTIRIVLADDHHIVRSRIRQLLESEDDAGLLSFLSPCVLPLVAVYLGYLSGHTLQKV